MMPELLLYKEAKKMIRKKKKPCKKCTYKALTNISGENGSELFTFSSAPDL